MHDSALRERRAKRLAIFGILAIAAIVAMALGYYLLAERLEFIAWTAGLVPHALVGLTGFYFAAAQRYQGGPHGRVTVNGEASASARVTLWQVNANAQKLKAVSVRTVLDKEGKFAFWTWRNHDGLYIVEADAAEADAKRTRTFEFKRGQRPELGKIELTRSTAVSQAGATATATPP